MPAGVPIRSTAAELLAEARRRTGIEIVDEAALGPLQVLLRSFSEDAALDFSRVGFGDLPFERCRHEDVTRREEKLIIRDRVGSREPRNTPGLRDVPFQFPKVEPLCIKQATKGVTHGDDFHAISGQ